MTQRKPFLVRLDPTTHEALQRWADSELRSLNAQIEYLLRQCLREAGRLRAEPPADLRNGETDTSKPDSRSG